MLLSVLLFLPDKIFDPIENKIAEFVGRFYRHGFMTIFLGTALLIVFFNQNLLYGDSNYVIKYIDAFPDLPSQAHNRLITVAIYRFFYVVTGDQWQGICIAHIIFGAIFLLFIRLAANHLFEDNTRRGFLFFGILFSGGFLLFTHAEFYAPAAVLASAFLYLSVLTRDNIRFFPLAFIVGSLAALFHPALFFLPFSLLAIPIHRYWGIKWVYILLPLFLIVIGVSIAAGAIMDIRAIQKALLPLSDPSYLLSGYHWLHLLNYIIYAGPLLFLIFYQGDRRYRIMAIIPLLVMPFLDFNFGGGDWDIAAMILLPVIFFALASGKRQFVILTVMGLVLYIPIFASGVSTDIAYERAEQIWLHQHVPYLEERFPGELRLLFLAREDYILSGDPEVMGFGEKYSVMSIRKLPENDRPYLYMADMYRSSGQAEKAIEVLLLGYTKARLKDRIYNNLASLYQESGKSVATLDYLLRKLGEKNRGT